jgi:hypothetical protein
MAADTDTPQLDADLHDVVFDYALGLAMQYENNPMFQAQVQIAENNLKTTLRRMRAHNQLFPRMMAEDEYNRGQEWRRLT